MNEIVIWQYASLEESYSHSECFIKYCFILQLIAVYDEQDTFPKSDDTNGSLTEGNSPDAFETDVAAQLAAFQPIGGEIEVTSSALKLGRYLHCPLQFS